MPWIRFKRDFDYPVPGKRAWLAFKAGEKYLTTTAIAKAAEAEGAAEKATKNGH